MMDGQQLVGVIAWALMTIGLLSSAWLLYSRCRAGAGWLERRRRTRAIERRINDWVAQAAKSRPTTSSAAISARPSSDGADSTPSTAP